MTEAQSEPFPAVFGIDGSARAPAINAGISTRADNPAGTAVPHIGQHISAASIATGLVAAAAVPAGAAMADIVRKVSTECGAHP